MEILKRWATARSKKKEQAFRFIENEQNKEQAEIPEQPETRALLNEPCINKPINEESNEIKTATDSQRNVIVEKPHRNRKVKRVNDQTSRIQSPAEIPQPDQIANPEILVEQENKTQKPKETRKRIKRKPKNPSSLSNPPIPTQSLATPSVSIPSISTPSISTSSISVPSVSASSKQDGCLHQLGFLHEISKVDELPEECMTCQKLLQCRYD